MLKKKNIAMVMAAATVATAVTPAFAAVNEENMNEASLISEVENLLATKYTDATETGKEDEILNYTTTNSVYDINAIVDENKIDILSVADLKTQIENSKLYDTSLVIEVIDKGHKTINGEIVAYETTSKRLYGTEEIETRYETESYTLEKLYEEIEKITYDNGDKVIELDKDDDGYVTLTFADGSTKEIVNGDYVLDLTKPVDANGNVIDLGNATDEIKAKIVGFEEFIKVIPGTETPLSAKQEIPEKTVARLTYDTTERRTIEIAADSILTSEGYTEEGAEFINTMRYAQKDSGTSVVKNGIKYTVELKEANIGEVKVRTTVYKLELILDVTNEATGDEQEVTIVVGSDIQKDLATILADIKDVDADDVVSIEGKVNKLVGEDRFATAIEVSKEQYAAKNTTVEGKEKAEAVILVGEEAIVDGLAAAPLAAQESAPILLTKKDAVPTETMNEIKRLVKKGTTIYLVGGEANISKDVEAQLIEEMNANIVRLAGEDRFETSLEIAEALTTEATEAFVVGGDGLADAMSIASIAAVKNAPIIVTAEDGLSRDAEDFLEDTTNINEVFVVGGEARVSTQVLKDIQKATRNTPKRIAGETRNETNAAVITEFASDMTGDKFASVYVAKDGDNALVDALAAAPLAAANDGVIVLATDSLAKNQNTAVKKYTTGKLTQVGGGIADSVIQKLVNILGL